MTTKIYCDKCDNEIIGKPNSFSFHNLKLPTSEDANKSFDLCDSCLGKIKTWFKS